MEDEEQEHCDKEGEDYGDEEGFDDFDDFKRIILIMKIMKMIGKPRTLF